MTEQSKRGYLILADISGYTSFLAKVELEHAHEILTDLLEVMVDKLKSMLTISKLEGDAVFAYVEEAKIIRGEILLELIENTYIAFRQRRDTSNRATTCSCRACQSMPSLELKFFVHCGSYVVQHVAGIRELVGSDVNLIHRLMKNHITEHTGWNAYALFSKYAMECMGMKVDDAHSQVETYEYLGDIDTITVNLHPRYEALAAERRYYLSEQDADLTISRKFNISDVELWQILTSVDVLTAVAQNSVTWIVASLTRGRTDIGAVNHCLHGKGKMRMTIVDWHPFTYFTGYCVEGNEKFYQMYEVQQLPGKDGSILHLKWKSDRKLPRWVTRLMGRMVVKKMNEGFCNMLDGYIAQLQHPTFQPEA